MNTNIYFCEWFWSYAEDNGISFGSCNLIDQKGNKFSTGIHIQEGINPTGMFLAGIPMVHIGENGSDIKNTSGALGFYERRYVGKIVRFEGKYFFKVGASYWGIQTLKKDDDTIYSRWVGATSEDLNRLNIDINRNVERASTLDHKYGIFSESYPPEKNIYVESFNVEGIASSLYELILSSAKKEGKTLTLEQAKEMAKDWHFGGVR